MRGVVLLALGLLVAGCTGPGADGEFRSLAMKAPSLLAAAAGPNGDLVGQTGTLTMRMQMSMGDQETVMRMPMQMDLELFQGGAYLMEVSMDEATVNGEPMPMEMQIRLFCSPAIIRIEGHANGEPLPESTVDNTLGSCPVTEEQTARLSQADLDAHVRESMGQLLDQGAIPSLTFKAVERAGDRDVAVYEYRLDISQQGMTMHFVIETRSSLEGGRITSMDITGTGNIGGAAQGQDVDADITMTGRLVYQYGTRAPIPAEFA